MKKILVILLSLSLLFAFAACGKNTSPDTTAATVGSTDTGTPVSTNTPADDGTTLSSMAVSEDAAGEAAAAAQLDGYTVDIDLAGKDKTTVTTQMQTIANDPKSYIGKTIRVSGTYEAYYSEATQKTYNNLLGFDTTGCCAAWGIEFYGDAVPDTIPDYETISVVGTIDTYDEDGQAYTFIDVSHFAM